MPVSRPVRNFLHLPSALCLDAPLVAVGWALLLAGEKGPVSLPGLAALFFAVWAVYLADRIRDSRKGFDPPFEPVRHRFARRHPLVLTALLSFAIAGGLAVALSGLERQTIVAGVTVAFATALYFFAFGWTGKTKFAPRLPGKEMVIAICFATGVSIGSGRIDPREWISPETAAMSLLFLANCLVISRAEADRDRSFDPKAFFSQHERSSLWISVPLALSASIGAWIMSASRPGVGTGLILCSAATWWINKWPTGKSEWVQPASDAILLIPWFIALATCFG